MLNGQKVTRDNLKQQAITLIRSLIEFSGTLEQLPGDRWITLRIQVKINDSNHTIVIPMM